MLLGERIRESRLKNNMTQQVLADLLHVSKTTISGYENNTKTPSIYNLEKLANTFNVSIDYLFGRDFDLIAEDSNIKKISKQDIAILNNLKSHRSLYHDLYLNSPRTIKMIEKIIKDNK